MTVSPPKRGPMTSARSTLVWTGTLLAMSSFGASAQSIQLQENLRSIAQRRELPAFYSRRTARDRFQQLCRRWRADTRWLSSTTQIAMHPAYQEIIGMGEVALPFILEDLRDHSGHWYWALKAISKEDPVPPRDRGAIKKMKAAWLRWGRAKGLVL
jgi:hypothetical protein